MTDIMEYFQYWDVIWNCCLEGVYYLRQFNFSSVILRLILALFCGGIIGAERSRKNRAAGFRTHMLVSMGAAITILLGQYEAELLDTIWAGHLTNIANADVTRFGAQVINGVGFLGAGTILLTDKRETKGLTTAAGLWASACMGLAIGAGFYECVLIVFVLIILSMRLLPFVESFIVEHTRNINLYVEFEMLECAGDILTFVKDLNVKVYDIDISHGKERYAIGPNATISLKLPKGLRRERLMAELSKQDHIVTIKEV